VVRRRPLTLIQALLFGLGFANLPVVLGTVLTRGGYGVAGVLRGLAFASLIGLAGTAAFWVISIRGRDISRDPVNG
jgi:ABC-type Co2+ transport system permease subunit